MGTPINLVPGERFNRLSFVGDLPPADGARWGEFRCDCGTIVHRPLHLVRRGHTKSCGCLRAEKAAINGVQSLFYPSPTLKHGEAHRTAEYRAWKAMKERCSYPSHVRFDRYGGRGIEVCERWRNSYEAFLADMGRKPSPKHSLDRHPDNNGNYEPGNVRWATPSEQAWNKRKQNK